MWKFAAVGVIIGVVVIFGFSLIDGGTEGEVTAQAVIAAPQTDLNGYTRADAPYTWVFPRDHGAHDSFQTEWWYYTGNLATADGRRFGYQFTVFRRAITSQDAPTVSEWRSNQVYMAHFTLSDVGATTFYHDERYSRGAAGLAGALPSAANPDALYQVYLEDWQITATDAAATQFTLNARSPQGFAVTLTLDLSKTPALQGEGGLSHKSSDPGNASYYYSL
ncbi:MAG: carotenoid 1,2-hydratase, partial [Armatimonadetes bacterium]|nr:carotenoid 1,2-hydratase [Anaerolineae bacterium]